MSPEALVEKWKHLFQLNTIPTWTEPWNLAFCAEQAEHARFGVEIGTYMGASANMMMLSNPHLHLWCVDKFSLIFGLEWVCRQKTLNPWIDSGSLELIDGDSAKGGEMLQHMKGRLDFVFVDDGHATEDVKRDIKWFYPLLKKGGVMFGHDWEGDNDVAQGVKQSGIPYDIPVPRMWRSIKL